MEPRGSSPHSQQPTNQVGNVKTIFIFQTNGTVCFKIYVRYITSKNKPASERPNRRVQFNPDFYTMTQMAIWRGQETLRNCGAHFNKSSAQSRSITWI